MLTPVGIFTIAKTCSRIENTHRNKLQTSLPDKSQTLELVPALEGLRPEVRQVSSFEKLKEKAKNFFAVSDELWNKLLGVSGPPTQRIPEKDAPVVTNDDERKKYIETHGEEAYKKLSESGGFSEQTLNDIANLANAHKKSIDSDLSP